MKYITLLALQSSENYASLHLHYTTSCIPPYTAQKKIQTPLPLNLQVRLCYNSLPLNYNFNSNSSYRKLELQLHYTSYSLVTTTTLHYATSGRCASGDHCNHSKKHDSNHLSVHRWGRSAIHASQQQHLSEPPVGFPTFETSSAAWCGHTCRGFIGMKVCSWAD